jgi:hypothetical protein
VIMILAFAMGIQNTLLRRWGIRDLATNLFTLRTWAFGRIARWEAGRIPVRCGAACPSSSS